MLLAQLLESGNIGETEAASFEAVALRLLYVANSVVGIGRATSSDPTSGSSIRVDDISRGIEEPSQSAFERDAPRQNVDLAASQKCPDERGWLDKVCRSVRHTNQTGASRKSLRVASSCGSQQAGNRFHEARSPANRRPAPRRKVIRANKTEKERPNDARSEEWNRGTCRERRLRVTLSHITCAGQRSFQCVGSRPRREDGRYKHRKLPVHRRHFCRPNPC